MLSVYRFSMCFTPKYWDSGQASIFLLRVSYQNRVWGMTSYHRDKSLLCVAYYLSLK